MIFICDGRASRLPVLSAGLLQEPAVAVDLPYISRSFSLLLTELDDPMDPDKRTPYQGPYMFGNPH